VAVVLLISFAPPPSFVSQSLAELDEKNDFTYLPATSKMSAEEVSEKLKPLVAVISPERRSWFGGQDIASGSFGAGILLQADVSGYLFATARHVIDNSFPTRDPNPKNLGALVAMASGTWAGAQVVARHKYLDLALLWLPRHGGHAEFLQPIAETKEVSEGENIFVIGHPEGLRYTLSTGIISRVSASMLQLTAPVSPGNSGGPVFDDHGKLVAIVTSMVDKNMDPNAENLNFAVRADALLRTADWDYSSGGRSSLAAYVERSAKSAPGAAAH
jgi:S1-C subfamily serine protease